MSFCVSVLDLVRKGVDVTRADSKGRTALHFASCRGDANMGKYEYSSDYRPPNFTNFSAELLPVGYQCSSIYQKVALHELYPTALVTRS